MKGSCAALLATALCVSMVHAQVWDYLPLTREEIGPPFRLRSLGSLDDTSGSLPTAAGPAGASFRFVERSLITRWSGGRSEYSDYVLTLNGLDRKGRPWSVDMLQPSCSGPPLLFERDLDRDRVIDIVAFIHTCGNGLAPGGALMTVTFDSAGRPVPFDAGGYFRPKGAGIDSLVDLNRDGTAELVNMRHSDGYWITDVYTADAARWRRIEGAFAGRTFPLHARFTGRPNRQATTPAPGRHPWAADLSTAAARFTGRLVEVKWPLDNSPETDVQLIVRSNREPRLACVVTYDVHLVMDDETEGRLIRRISERARPEVEPLLQRAVSGGFTVQLYGRSRADRCSPEVVWVTGGRRDTKTR